MEQRLIEEIKQWAIDNYSTSYGCSVIVECWDCEMWDQYKTVEEVKSYVAIVDEQYLESKGH